MAVPFTIDRIIPYRCMGIGNVTKLITIISCVYYFPVVTTVAPAKSTITPDAYTCA